MVIEVLALQDPLRPTNEIIRHLKANLINLKKGIF